MTVLNSKNHVKFVTQHIRDEYLETCEDIRYTRVTKNFIKKEKKP